MYLRYSVGPEGRRIVFVVVGGDLAKGSAVQA